VSECILELRNVSKRFPGVQALSGVTFGVRPGEIHALVGENGAGKTTLIKIASGVYSPDEGEILLNGQPIRLASPRDAQGLGIATVHQEASLYPDLSVLENIFMGRQPTRGRLGLIDWKRMRREAERIFRSMGVELDLDAPVGQLSVADQQLVQIGKALSQEARVLIMDEPTSSLSSREVDVLFNLVRHLREQGVAIVYITHRIDEVFVLAERVTVLRDGRLIGTHRVSDVTSQQLINMMVGRVLHQLFPKEKVEIGPPLLRVRGLSKEGRFRDISFELHRGEILGFAGLIGAGRTEIALALFGIDPADEGEIEIEGQRVVIKNPWDALSLGLAYLPEDRQHQGIVSPMLVRENISLAVLESLCHFGFISFRTERQLAEEYVDKLAIRTPSVEQIVANLSGGNQQKVVVARWLCRQPRILIMDEPTRGIDVGAKAEIHRLMSDLAKQGIGIIMISSELPEILGMSDRILVMQEGRITGELSREEASQERIMSLAATGNMKATVGTEA